MKCTKWQWERQELPMGHQNGAQNEAPFLMLAIPMPRQWAQSNMSTYSGIRTNGRFHCQLV
ncbi:hypothetical protein T06_3421 [Trichinella sp. T6]|nr:hypothetical protein T06_3421 [Trichinella sp. T6]